jgi:hypothetical protein
MNVSNFRDELEEVWVPKDVGELEGLILTIQNEPGKKILKHKIQQVVKEKEERRKNSLNNRNQDLWDDYDDDWDNDWDKDYTDYIDDGGYIDYSRFSDDDD